MSRTHTRGKPKSARWQRLSFCGRQLDYRAPLFRRERRRRHPVYTAHVQIFCVRTSDELQNDFVEAARICKTVDAVRRLRDDDVPAVRQVTRNFLAALRRRYRI